MKTLSLKQPFAELVVSGKKTIELRNWNTKFRGKFLIHASKIPDSKAMKKFGFDKLPVDKHLADSSWGKYGFLLQNAKRIQPIKANGKLGFWEFKS